MNKNEVNTAFEIVLEEIEEVFNVLTREGEEAFKNKDFATAQKLTEDGKKLTTFREKVKALQQEWQVAFESTIRRKTRTRIKSRKIKERLKKGLRTPEKEFIRPILRALVEIGGKGEMKEVLEKVYMSMKSVLNKYDMQPLPSNPKAKRWENTAQWARNAMVTDGLLKSKSPRGEWEITEKGRKFIEDAH